MGTPWGWELIVDMQCGQMNYVTDPEYIADFARTLVKQIDMVAFGEPQVVHFADHCQDKAGWTLIQLMETSNITAHFLDNNGDAYINVFSCKTFDPNVVSKVIQDWFNPVSISTFMIERNARVNNL